MSQPKEIIPTPPSNTEMFIPLSAAVRVVDSSKLVSFERDSLVDQLSAILGIQSSIAGETVDTFLGKMEDSLNIGRDEKPDLDMSYNDRFTQVESAVNELLAQADNIPLLIRGILKELLNVGFTQLTSPEQNRIRRLFDDLGFKIGDAQL